ncbi:MAG: EscU/YscU/HrcU family type III secretion system export apparatus switch protein [Chloroflexota bacterium]
MATEHGEHPGDGRIRATALRYQPERDSAPRVVGSGAGYLAERIIAVAAANGIPIVQDQALTAALSALPLGSEIPPALYEAVARVLAYIYSVDRQGQA